MSVLVFQDFGFLENPFGFYFIFFFADFFIEPVLLKSKSMDMVDYLFKLVVFVFALLLELKLSVE